MRRPALSWPAAPFVESTECVPKMCCAVPTVVPDFSETLVTPVCSTSEPVWA
jgi:hypothetical protein